MITAPYIRDKKPSWISGRENAILPYRLFHRDGKIGVISPNGEEYRLYGGEIDKCLYGNVNGIVMGRLTFTVTDGFTLTATITHEEIGDKPTGEGCMWIDQTGYIYADYGEMTCFGLHTGEKTPCRIFVRARTDITDNSEEMFEPVMGKPKCGQRDILTWVTYDRSTILLRGDGEISLQTFKGVPFSGVIVGRENDDYLCVSGWSDGRFVTYRKDYKLDPDVADTIDLAAAINTPDGRTLKVNIPVRGWQK